MKPNRDTEQHLGGKVRVHKTALLTLLGPDCPLVKRQTHGGSGDPETFEDFAAAVFRSGRKHAEEFGQMNLHADSVGACLQAFQKAVNDMWGYAQLAEIPEFLVKTWRLKHKGYSWISREDCNAEALMKLRYFIVRFVPGHSDLAAYAQRGMHQHLTEWAAQQGPLTVPQKTARGYVPDAVELPNESMELDDDEYPAFPPELVDGSCEDAVIAKIDGDFREEDL